MNIGFIRWINKQPNFIKQKIFHMYSQNGEEKIIKSFFKDFKGCILDIGANDGTTFSNSRGLIEDGWEAVLVEPSPWAFKKLEELYTGNDKVILSNIAISDMDGSTTLHDSGSLVSEKDKSLVSTLIPSEKLRWRGTVSFEEVKVNSATFARFYKAIPKKIFHCISIDAEGFDFIILLQIPFNEVGCRCVCVEWNGIDFQKYDNLLKQYAFKLIEKNGENLIYVR